MKESSPAQGNPDQQDSVDNKVLRLTREFDAPLETLYQAFTNPAIMAQWFGPESMRVYRCEVDLELGGAWFVGLETASGEHRDVYGRFTLIDNLALAFTWRWVYPGAPDTETRVNIVFESISRKRSRIHLTQQVFDSEDARNSHNQGWSSSFNSLQTYLKQNR